MLMTGCFLIVGDCYKTTPVHCQIIYWAVSITKEMKFCSKNFNCFLTCEEHVFVTGWCSVGLKTTISGWFSKWNYPYLVQFQNIFVIWIILWSWSSAETKYLQANNQSPTAGKMWPRRCCVPSLPKYCKVHWNLNTITFCVDTFCVTS